MNLRERFIMHGFSELFVLPMPKYEEWTRLRTKGVFHHDADYIVSDAMQAYPYANALLIGLYPYQPYRETNLVASYYPASNRAYHSMKALREELRAEGILAEIADVPLRSCLLSYGIGTQMDNQLLFIKPYGTYFVLQALAVFLQDPVYTPRTTTEPVCDHCGACQSVCTGAIHGNGVFSVSDCIRAHYEDEELSKETMQRMHTLLGCMDCQNGCPKQTVAPVSVPKEVREAFDPVSVLTASAKQLKELVGFNIRVRHIRRQAIVLCGNQKRMDALPILRKMERQNDPFYRGALEYAISLLQNHETVVK